MRTILFRKEAEADLRSIIAYYEDVAPEAIPNILSDIYRSIDQLVRYPHSGMRVTGRPFRRIVTIKYHFKLAYEVGEDRIVILGVFRYQDREA
ncbi:MAG TPA: type II toxin-antitoxin system RelE/ParE family toxin [Sphingopyxis sp.]|nr:type II toxin-antitoxin system RelE/ParE family toxin [Sphingopyxis sp.]HMP45565.1 type II toxin-antitoxin system RelE/ParE family toxin [Sphingopyxis sp.]HMQ18429.1 type II toxin-antitoxin system RelE/ParE family toxin [Sphingopyxis sp.]